MAPYLDNEVRKVERDVKGKCVMGNVMNSLRVIKIQLVAFIILFLVSGLVPLRDLVSLVFSKIHGK